MAKPKNPSNAKKIQTLLGRKPSSVRARIAQITKLVGMYGLDSRKYHDDSWQALRDYDKVISSLGCEFTYWCENGGYTDRDPQDGMPRSKVYNVKITYPDGMAIGGYIKMMAAGTVSDPFDAYDTCIVLWPKTKNDLTENRKSMKQVLRLTEGDVTNIVKGAVNRVLNEYFRVNDEITHDEIVKVVSILKEKPIDAFYKPVDLGLCKVQRVSADTAGGKMYLMKSSTPDSQDLYNRSHNGFVYIQIGRKPNTSWYDDGSGKTYMCWK